VANLAAAFICLFLMAVPGRMDEHLVLQGLICLVIPLAYVLHLFVRGIFRKEKLRMVFGAADDVPEGGASEGGASADVAQTGTGSIE
jgi:hypothetical protein